MERCVSVGPVGQERQRVTYYCGIAHLQLYCGCLACEPQEIGIESMQNRMLSSAASAGVTGVLDFRRHVITPIRYIGFFDGGGRCAHELF